VVSISMLMVFTFMFKLIQQNHILQLQDDSNRKVIAFLQNLFSQNQPQGESQSLFTLLKTTDLNKVNEIPEQIKILEPAIKSPFSPFVFTNHSVKTNQNIQLQLTQSQALKEGFDYQIVGSGSITKSGIYNVAFTQTGVKTVTITASNGDATFDLLLNFIVRDDKQMPFTFTDVATDHPHYAEIHYLALKGILIGRPGQTESTRIFSPQKSVNQAEALKIIMLAAHERNITTLIKSDNVYPNLTIINHKGGVEDFSWASAFLDASTISNAIENVNTFDPKAIASKEWLARILVKTLNLYDPSEFMTIQEYEFSDIQAFTSAQGYDFSRVTAFYNLLGRLGTQFSPSTALTREDIALIAGKILQLPVVGWEVADNEQLDAPVLTNSPESFNINNLSDLQTPGYQRVGNNIITLDENDPNRARLEFKMVKDQELIIILSNANNNVRNSFSIPLNSNQIESL
jgi:hypothetical protein